jgi:hypothetical protein
MLYIEILDLTEKKFPMKDMNQEQGTALKCSHLGCNTGRQIVPGVSKDC